MKTRIGIAASSVLLIALAAPVVAQQDSDRDIPGRSAVTAPQTPEIAGVNSAQAADISDQSIAANSGPVRLARFSSVSGSVSWRADAQQEWGPACINMPLQQGAQIEVPNGSRAEIQFDDGSVVRLGGGAAAVLQTLYSDPDGEFTEISLHDGVAWVEINNNRSIFQVDTPVISAKSAGPSAIQVGAVDGAQIAAFDGTAVAENPQGSLTLKSGQYCDIRDENSQLAAGPIPAENGWVRWNQTLDSKVEDQTNRDNGELPPDIALVAGDLDSCGTWESDPDNGQVWCPHVTDPTWRPYRDGRWAWVEPFGLTWVSNESWGWAPYHYGTWVHLACGWCWAPGPALQYWSPALVSFYECDGCMAWCPLSPSEIAYPTVINIGYAHGTWTTRFSIGACAVYCPTNGRRCVARAWGNHEINSASARTTKPVDRNSYIEHGFVSVNVLYGGGSMIPRDAIGGRGKNTIARPAEPSMFTKGRLIGAPAGSVVSGPGFASVAAAPIEHTSVSHHAVEFALNRPVVRTPVDTNIERTNSHAEAVARIADDEVRGSAEARRPSEGQLIAQRARGTLGIVERPSSTPQRRSDEQTQPGVPGRQTARPEGPETAPFRPSDPISRPAPPARPYTPPVQPYTPPVRPPVRPYTPPVQPYTPPVRPYTPPVQPYTPPVRPYTPPVQPYTPPVQPTPPARPYTPPVQPYTPPVQPYTPPVQPYTPPVERDTTPPERTYTPPVQRENPPERTYTPPPPPVNRPVRRPGT